MDPLLEVFAFLACAAHLPQSCDAGPYREPCISPVRTVGVLMLGGRTRAYHAHLAPQDINELGDLIDIRIAKELSNSVDARVVLHLELGAIDLVDDAELFLHIFGRGDHTAELEAIEILTAKALTTGTVKNGPG
jgi:hypothetical protein